MKGVVLDFNNKENIGLILGEDGNRYSFDYEKDWKSKNKNVEIDSTVDFVINENSASEIFSLNQNATPIKNEVKINKKDVTNNIKNSNCSLKKIDFEKYEKEIKDIDSISRKKKENIKTFFITALLIPVMLLILYISIDAKWGDFITIIIFLFFLSSIFSTLVALKNIFFAKNQLKDDILDSKFKEELQIIDFTPNNINFEPIEIIHVVDKTFDGARKKLIDEAYRLKADAIINYSYQSTTTPRVKTTTSLNGSKDIKTDVMVSNIINATAIRILD